jgi:hypothetical protein
MRNVTTVFLLALTISAASAAVIDQNLGGVSGTKSEFFGQSFTTPVGGPINNIEFSFYMDLPPVTLTAGGTAFLLNEAFAGAPSALSLAAPGLIAESTGITAGAFIFAPSVTLQSNTKYFLYENAVLTASGGNAITGGEAYFSLDPNTAFTTSKTLDLTGLQSANFVLSTITTTNASVPEPATLIILVAGLGAVALKRRRSASSRAAAQLR